MNARLVQGGLTALAATALLISSTAPAYGGPDAPPRGITPEAISLRHAPRGDGGIAGFGGGGGPCVYARDDGGSETALGQAGAGTVGMANAFALTVSCSTVNVIQVAWGPNSEPQPATVAIYADPNGDGDPSDVTVADLIVQATGVTASSNTDIFVNYPIPDTVLPFDFFVIAITQDIGDGQFPLAIDTTATQSSSWTLLGISDVDDPFQNNGFLNNLDNIGFAGNHMVRVAFSETAGDECEDCFNVVEGTHVGSTANATGSTGDDTSCATGDTIDVWYCYTASCDGTATASLCDGTDFDTTLAIFSACDGDELFCDDDGCGGVGVPSEISWGVTAGTAYYVRVSGWNGDTGNYTLNIACESTLVNDDCADALPIVDGLTAFNTNDATTDGPENPAGICNDFGSTQTANDIWFDYTAICDGELLVTTCEDLGGSAEYDSDLVLYDGHECPVDNDRLLGCNDDDPDNPCGTDSFHSTVRIPVVAGQAIKIRVGGWGANDRGPGVLLVDCSPPNDDCADALPIADGLNSYDTSGASTDGPVHAACQYDGQLYNDIWFDYTATCTGDLLVTTCTDLGGFAGYDTDLAVYEGTDCPVTDERLLGCNDDDSGNPCGQAPPWASTVVVPVIAGQSYKIRVGGFGPADAGPGELLIECTGNCESTLNVRPATPINPLGYAAGAEVVMVLEMSDLCAPSAGFQAFLEFDEAELTFVGGSYTAAPFGQPIIDPIAAVAGTINLAAGIDQTIGQAPSDQAAILAELRFTAVEGFCLPESLAFRDNVPPTRLTLANGDPLLPLSLTAILPATCKADVNLDGEVDIDDLMAIVMDWANTDPCNTDTDGNGVVDVDDLVHVILSWGPCP